MPSKGHLKRSSSRKAPSKHVKKMRRVVVQAPRSAVGQLKCVDIPTTTIDFVNTGGPPNPTQMNVTQVGSNFWNRIGSRIQMKSLHFRGSIYPNTGINGTDPDDTVRVIVFYDKSPNAVPPTWSDLVKATDNSGSTATGIRDGLNMFYRDRFIVLIDQIIDTPQFTSNGTSLTSVQGVNYQIGEKLQHYTINRYIKLPNLITQYRASSGSASDMVTGGLWLVAAMGNIPIGGANPWKMEWSSRIKFADY